MIGSVSNYTSYTSTSSTSTNSARSQQFQKELLAKLDSNSDGEARELADSLRKSVLRPSVAHQLRKRGAAMIREVYSRGGDKDALLDFVQAENTLLERHLSEQDGGRALTTG